MDADRHLTTVLIIAILLYYDRMVSQGGRQDARHRNEPLVGELQVFKAQFFRALAHPVRIRLLETLVRGGRTVQELQEALKLDQPLVSQQLAVLRNQHVVTTQKEGLSVRYRLRDPLVGELLHVARRIFNNHFASRQGLLRELRREVRRA
jgi:DNA-binding transcriptional ArsR family regulator